MPTAKKEDRPRHGGLKKIVFVGNNGTEEVIEVDKTTSFVIAYATNIVKNAEGTSATMNYLAVGYGKVLGELFHGLGNEYPELLRYAAEKGIKKAIEEILEKVKSGEMPDDTFEKMEPVGNA